MGERHPQGWRCCRIVAYGGVAHRLITRDQSGAVFGVWQPRDHIGAGLGEPVHVDVAYD